MLPISYIEDNRIFDTSGRAYAVFKIASQPYAFQPKHMRLQVIDRVTRAMSGLAGEFWIYLLTQQWSIDQVLRSMRGLSQHSLWKEHQDEVRDVLGHRLPFHRVNLIVIPLGRKRVTVELTTDNWREWLRQATAGVTDVKNRLVMGQEVISEEKLEAARQESDEWFIKLQPIGKVERVRLRDVEWFLKRSYFRGLPEPKMVLPDPLPVQVITRGRQGWVRPHRAMFLALSDVLCHEKPNHMIIEYPDGPKSHQTFFTTVGVPNPIDDRDPTGFEWMYGVLEQLPYPVDAALHVRVEDPHEALAHLQKKKKTAESQYREWADNNEDIPLELEEDMATVDVLEKKLRSRQPLVHTQVVFGVGAKGSRTSSGMLAAITSLCVLQET